MQFIDGRKISKDILASISEEVKNISFTPVFCDVLAGEDPASLKYVKMKERMAEKLGVKFHRADFPSSIKTEELIQEIKKINKIQNMCGVIVQLPLPPNIDTKKVLNSIDSRLDVDCLGEDRGVKFYSGKDVEFFPPTASAVIEILDSLNIDFENKKITILGFGELVGRPIDFLLRERGLSVTVVRSKTENKKEIIKDSDLVVCGVGKGHFVTGDMLKDGVVVVDAGTSESGGSIVGDVDLISVQNKDGYITPVPGGVGPVTIAMLFNNVLKVAKIKDEENA